MKTNGARFLESLGIPFELREYEVDPNDLSALTVAKKIDMPPEQVFKTLLTTSGPGVYVFAVIPGDAELDFKKLARAAGLRKAEMAPLKDVQPLIGYIRGGVTVFGAKKPYPVFIDETAILFDKISVSAGTRGAQLILSPDDYLRAVKSLNVEVQTADLTKDPSTKAPGIKDPRAPSLRLFSGARVGENKANDQAGAPDLASETWESTTTDSEGQTK
ncbi:MAG: Cys-tRNA(Pro) deacylase [Terracidiphilus sp.]|jgi:Cys-tRNA(Pro)/Cys-tRNA(Cys) deacylase